MYPLNEKIGKTNVSNKTKQFKFGLVFMMGYGFVFHRFLLDFLRLFLSFLSPFPGTSLSFA